MQCKITDEQSANEALKTVVVGSKVRITFRADAGDKLYSRLGTLRHKLDFNFEWLVLVHNCVAAKGVWEGIPRVQDFAITRMSGADCQVFGCILADTAESIELLFTKGRFRKCVVGPFSLFLSKILVTKKAAPH